MKTSVWFRSPTCLSAVRTYVDLLRETAGLPVALCQDQPSEDLDGDGVVYVDLRTDVVDAREAWDADEEEEQAESPPAISSHTAAQYCRNLQFLGRQEQFAAAWLAGLRAGGQTSHE